MKTPAWFVLHPDTLPYHPAGALAIRCRITTWRAEANSDAGVNGLRLFGTGQQTAYPLRVKKQRGRRCDDFASASVVLRLFDVGQDLGASRGKVGALGGSLVEKQHAWAKQERVKQHGASVGARRRQAEVSIEQ